MDGKVERVYCSLQCQADFEFAASYAKWLRGDGGPKAPKALKRFLVERDGFRCDECGITDWNGKPICLELEHKSGNNDDDSPENLVLLCPNCHSQTSTYKAKNRGNGRHARRMRYAEGLSY